MAAHNLGTRIKNDIILSDLHPVSGTEWFSVETTAAWKLFRLNCVRSVSSSCIRTQARSTREAVRFYSEIASTHALNLP